LEINELKALSDYWLNFSVNIIRQGGRFTPLFDIVSASGHYTVAVNESEHADAQMAKNAAAAKVLETIREKQAFAVVHVSDAATMAISNTHPHRALAFSGRYSFHDLEHMGIGKRREAVLVSLDTPNYRRVLKQYYGRCADGALILQERTDVDSTSPNWNGGVQGRFFDFFAKEKAASS
jgi:hypothetical protein